MRCRMAPGASSSQLRLCAMGCEVSIPWTKILRDAANAARFRTENCSKLTLLVPCRILQGGSSVPGRKGRDRQFFLAEAA